jgi:hypothetical protein
LRVERQERLDAQQHVQIREADEAERNYGKRVRLPPHLATGVDPAEPEDAALHGRQHRREEHPLAFEDARHVYAERFHERADERENESGLQPPCDSHQVVTPLKVFGAQHRIRQVHESGDGQYEADEKICRHTFSKPIT